MKKRISLLLAAALLAGTLSGCSGTNPIDWVKQKFRDVTGVSGSHGRSDGTGLRRQRRAGS